ncbi:MAG TPA: glycoside hydrolase family 3 N-terminal domain-containing protein [Thermoanaerobaculia bacterium]
MKRLLAILLITTPLFAADARTRWVEKTLRSMTLDEKIGQMIMPGYEIGSFRNVDSDEFAKVRRYIVEFHVGGVHVYGGDPTPVALAINEMQKLAKVPLLISDNFEGGVGYVLFGGTRLPLAMAIGATGDVNLAYEAAKLTAEEGRAIGVNVNFYPVADVQNNPANPIINIRAFGEDPATVSRFVSAYIRGAQENGQIATAKHFPGHGDVASDSHLEMPVLNVTAQRLESIELPPFRAAVDQHVAAFMSAHIWLPQIEPEKGLPSTLSKKVITGILRDELGFDGVVFTDAMTMRGVSANFKNDDATVRAVEAGADIILIPPSVEDSFWAIKSALESGRLTESRIDASARRILKAKAHFDLANPKNRFVNVDRLMTILGTREHRDFAQRIEDQAITLVRDDAHALPLRPSPDLRVVQINVLDSRSGWREGAVGRVVAAELPKRFPRAVTVQVDDQSTPTELDLIRKLAMTGDALVVNGFIRVAAYKGSIDLTPAEATLLRDLAGMKKPFVFTVFGSPYVLTHIPELPSYIVTYDTSPLAEMAAVRAITGEIEFKGKLPISLPGLYPIGHGLK